MEGFSTGRAAGIYPVICPTCGYEPMEGRDGFHSCKQQIQSKDIVEGLKDILKPIPKTPNARDYALATWERASVGSRARCLQREQFAYVGN